MIALSPGTLLKTTAGEFHWVIQTKELYGKVHYYKLYDILEKKEHTVESLSGFTILTGGFAPFNREPAVGEIWKPIFPWLPQYPVKIATAPHGSTVGVYIYIDVDEWICPSRWHQFDGTVNYRDLDLISTFYRPLDGESFDP